MQLFNEFLLIIDSYLGSASWFAYFLLGTGLFFTLYLKFLHRFASSLKLFVQFAEYMTKRVTKVTPHIFKHLPTALSGTVGTGNIAGVGLCSTSRGPCCTLLDAYYCCLRYDDKMCRGYTFAQIQRANKRSFDGRRTYVLYEEMRALAC